MSFGVYISGERKTTMGNRVLDPGECDRGTGLCVLSEREYSKFLFQDLDFPPYDGKCNFVIIFKRIEDPQKGTLYKYYRTTDCSKNT
jgi:hypothetical protein